jgi:hypothetical protein
MHIQRLEPRQMFANFFLSDTGILTVNAGPRNNNYFVSAIKDSYVLWGEGDAIAAFKKRDVVGILMFGNQGDDRLSVGVRIPATLVGGAGNDTLLGGTGDDILVGGIGNDRLDGRDGNDILRGDDGNDRLFGSNGDDLLFAGPGNNRSDGGRGTNTALDTPGATDTRRNIQTTQPDSFRPTGREFPESLASVNADATVTVVQREARISVAYTAPAGTRVLFAPLPRLRLGNVQLMGLALSSTSGPAAAPPFSTSLPALAFGDYTFQLSAPEGLLDTTPFSVVRV